ncbi:MAG: aminotransferase class I/II-fold pyridoxal phosphate-dependent enzyme [Ruminococcus sp.]|jgi:threonine-phosphate decarboxylase|nr:aminotransferase class I/II-fold pyridoxal phosphate-dependent enzyme [Ruminococcus sp.]
MDYVHGGDIYTYEGMIDFSINVNPFGPSPSVIEAAYQAVKTIGAYPDSRCRKLRQALESALQVPQNTLVFGNGAADLIFSLVFSEKPRKALLTAPSFLEYAQALEAGGCEVCYHYLKEEKNFQLDEDYLEMLTEDIDMIFLCSPDNPTGNLIERSLLCKIAEICEKQGIRMVLDECFYEFLEDTGDVLSHTEIWTYPHLFLLRAFTKMHAMPGLRLGYGITADQTLISKMEKVRQPWSVSAPAQAAGIAALDEAERMKKTVTFVIEERKILEKELGRIGVRYFPSSANYMLLKSSYDLFTLLKQRKILIRDCSNYEGLEKGFYRVAVKRREENCLLVQALEEIIHG